MDQDLSDFKAIQIEPSLFDSINGLGKIANGYQSPPTSPESSPKPINTPKKENKTTNPIKPAEYLNQAFKAVKTRTRTRKIYHNDRAEYFVGEVGQLVLRLTSVLELIPEQSEKRSTAEQIALSVCKTRLNTLKERSQQGQDVTTEVGNIMYQVKSGHEINNHYSLEIKEVFDRARLSIDRLVVLFS
jgi:hypothetical protein